MKLQQPFPDISNTQSILTCVWRQLSFSIFECFLNPFLHYDNHLVLVCTRMQEPAHCILQVSVMNRHIARYIRHAQHYKVFSPKMSSSCQGITCIIETLSPVLSFPALSLYISPGMVILSQPAASWITLTSCSPP